MCNLKGILMNMGLHKSCVQSTPSMMVLSFVALGCLASVSYCSTCAFHHHLVTGWQYLFLFIE
jgi:hypothetical protein